jgi:hypothetical protein
VPGHNLARVDADAGLERRPVDAAKLLAQLGQRLAHLRRHPHRSQRVVLAQQRDAEHGHDRVAHELLDGPAVALDRLLHQLEVAEQHPAQALASRRSPSAVEPVTSQKRTVTVFRSSRAAGSCAASAAAQLPQKRKPAGFSAPQLEQIGTS